MMLFSCIRSLSICVASVVALAYPAIGQTPVVPIYLSGVTSCSAVPPSAMEIGEQLFFLAEDDEHGCELWLTDGTEAGTSVVRDIYPGSASAFADGNQRILALAGSLLFVADDGQHGLELWRSDGTERGTGLVRDICAGGCSAFDTDPEFPTMVLADGGALFVAADQVHGAELWRTDGTEGGTLLVKDINPGSADSFTFSKDYSDYVPYFTNFNGTILFAARDGETGFELWRTDGTATGTSRVRDINPGPSSSLFQDGLEILVNRPDMPFRTVSCRNRSGLLDQAALWPTQWMVVSDAPRFACTGGRCKASLSQAYVASLLRPC